MIPPSKMKESNGTRRVPTPAGASRTRASAESSATTAPAQKFRVWPEDQRKRIATKAYELWEQRGCRHGYDLADWCDAEALVIETRHDVPE